MDLPGGPYKVPRTPLMRWALRRIDRIALPAWSAVCNSGMKLQNDDPEHTDWMVGGGIALELYDDPEFKTAQYELKARLQQEHAGFEVAVLHGAGSGFIAGTARVIKRPHDADPASITRSTILVIPQADARFLEHALNAGAVICAAGGEMAHLVTVMREHSLPILMYRNALRDIQDGTRLIAWPKEGRIDLTALPTA